MVNRAATLASLLVGMGPYKFNSFCQHLDMSGLAQKSFNKHASHFYNKNEALVDHFSHRGRSSNLLTWNALKKPGVLFSQFRCHQEGDKCFFVVLSFSHFWFNLSG